MDKAIVRRERETRPGTSIDDLIIVRDDARSPWERVLPIHFTLSGTTRTWVDTL